jgi:hypothetical protein
MQIAELTARYTLIGTLLGAALGTVLSFIFSMVIDIRKRNLEEKDRKAKQKQEIKEERIKELQNAIYEEVRNFYQEKDYYMNALEKKFSGELPVAKTQDELVRIWGNNEFKILVLPLIKYFKNGILENYENEMNEIRQNMRSYYGDLLQSVWNQPDRVKTHLKNKYYSDSIDTILSKIVTELDHLRTENDQTRKSRKDHYFQGPL